MHNYTIAENDIGRVLKSEHNDTYIISYFNQIYQNIDNTNSEFRKWMRSKICQIELKTK